MTVRPVGQSEKGQPGKMKKKEQRIIGNSLSWVQWTITDIVVGSQEQWTGTDTEDGREKNTAKKSN